MIDPPSVWYVQGSKTCEALDAYFRTVVEWLDREGFCNRPGAIEVDVPVGHVLLCPRGVDDEHWHLYYEPAGGGKDTIGNAVVLAKSNWRKHQRLFDEKPDRYHEYVCRFFQCDLGDPNLWERTVNALRAFRYSYWPK